ncbi:MAG: hypothetical protein ACK5MU_01950 [Candidatus Saccharimonadales bacterium]
MGFFDKFKKVTPPEVTMSFSEALQTSKTGGPKVEPEEAIPDKVWTDIWRLMLPYTQTVAAECAEIYVMYVAKTGNTTCPRDEVAYHMRDMLWDAFRRADIQRRYPMVHCLPNLAPYFVDMVKLLNKMEIPSNHVAYFCEKDIGTNNTAWYVAPKDAAKQKPKVATGKNDVIDKMLC